MEMRYVTWAGEDHQAQQDRRPLSKKKYGFEFPEACHCAKLLELTRGQAPTQGKKMYGLSKRAILAAILFAPTLASAQFIEQTFDGTISGSNTIDTAGMFGVVGANLAGDSFTSTYLLDTSTASFGIGAHSFYYDGLTSASIAINGVTYNIPSSTIAQSRLTDYVEGFSTSTVAAVTQNGGTTLVDAMGDTLPSYGPLPYPIPPDPTQPFNHAFNAAAGDSAGGSFVDGALNLTLNEIFVERHDVVSIGAPEIDPASASSALTLLLGSIFVLRSRSRRQIAG
jgi:hypothetical protein